MELSRIKCFAFDLDGTVYLSGKLISGARETLDIIRSHGGSVKYLTNNASVSRVNYMRKLNALGLNAEVDDIITAGAVAAAYLAVSYKGKRVYVFGTDDLKDEVRSHGVTVVDDNPDVVLLGYKTDLKFDDLTELCTLIKGGVPYIATHGDPFCPIEGGIMPDVGAFIKLVETATDESPVTVCGKPYLPMKVYALRNFGVDAEHCAVVGDRLTTDMELAIRYGMTSILTLTGDATREQAEAYHRKPDYIFENIGELGEELRRLYRIL